MQATKANHFECLDCTVKVDSQNPIRLLTIYRPHGSSMTGFLKEFSYVLSEITLQNTELFVLGDINIHLDQTEKQDTRDFIDILSMYGLCKSKVRHILESTSWGS